MVRALFLVLIQLMVFTGDSAAGEDRISRVWLSHQSNPSTHLTVNWQSSTPGPSLVEFGSDRALGKSLSKAGSRKIHHLEIPRGQPGSTLFYRVRTGKKTSAIHSVKPFPKDKFRLAIAANWQGKPGLSSLVADKPDLLLSAGDHINNLWSDPDSFGKLIDHYPAIFSSVPFLPVLGNHDREISPRGDKPPAEPVYDIDAKTYRNFFSLPGDEWKWHLDFPSFDLRLTALDFNHTSDLGTTWQSCHAVGTDSAQFRWYRSLTDSNPPFTITLYNERNVTVRNLAGRAWGPLLEQNTLCVAGFGHFAERAGTTNTTFYNTSLFGKGHNYPDPLSKYLASENSYLLIVVDRKNRTMTAVLKSLEGRILDRKIFNHPERKN